MLRGVEMCSYAGEEQHDHGPPAQAKQLNLGDSRRKDMTSILG